ncbi:acyl-CoA N-acyltransferase [Rhizodiscina lignyota]|uniref:Acyl-CoA N-acyltransferase n=1 Tax=Rhizodiscina lignyota TaxID=1504668 RepID=A0A9P4I3Q4_9PEZI|nr:acyl-CoA N-acyltransferase [Rhizodiscina lignyota]
MNSQFPLNFQTDRLQIQELSTSDMENFYSLESIPEVVRYQDWSPRSRAQAATLVQDIVDNQSKFPRTLVELAVIKKDENAFIGRVGAKIDHGISKADIWFSFMPSAQGKGFATEAMEALITTLTTNFDVTELEIECDPRNTGSWRLAERLGFEKVKDIERAWESKGEWVGSRVYMKNLRTADDG